MSNVVPLHSRAGASRVVIALRNAKTRAGYCNELRRGGFNVLEAGSAEETLAHFGPRDHELLICEQELGDDSSLAVLEILACMRIHAPMQRVLIVGGNDAAHEFPASYGIVAFLPDEVTPSELLDAVRRLI